MPDVAGNLTDRLRVANTAALALLDASTVPVRGEDVFIWVDDIGGGAGDWYQWKSTFASGDVQPSDTSGYWRRADSPSGNQLTGTATAGEGLSALRVATFASNGHLFYADQSTATDIQKDKVLIISAALSGATATYLSHGQYSDGSWNWDITKGIFLGASGGLTQTVPATGFIQIVARPTSTTSLSFDLEESIQL